MNDIAEAFGEFDEQAEAVPVASNREEGLTQLHQTKADALAMVRPLRELTVARNGLKAVVDGRKAVVKLRTSVDKRRKALNAEAKSWIDTVNATAKEILAIIEPVEDYLKTQEVIHERQKREAEEAERAERIALRRATWPADGEFPEIEAGTLSAVDWNLLVFRTLSAEAKQRQQAEQHAAERAELEEYRRLKEQRDREFAERLQERAEATGYPHEFRRSLNKATMPDGQISYTPAPIEPPAEPVVLPVSEGVGRIADELREVWTPEPTAAPERDAATRLADLIRSLRYLVRMQGEVDWRGQITEAITDAQS